MKKTEVKQNKVSLRLNPMRMHVNPDLFVPATEEEKQEQGHVDHRSDLESDLVVVNPAHASS